MNSIKGYLCIVFFLASTLMGALPPQLTDVRGFLQKQQGPLADFTESLAVSIPPESSFFSVLSEPEGSVHRADYLFDDLEVIVFLFEDDLAELYPWRNQNQLCDGRNLLLLSDGGLLAAGLVQDSGGILVFLRDTEVDLCSFLDIFLPLQVYFNRGAVETPQFPGALGTLP